MRRLNVLLPGLLALAACGSKSKDPSPPSDPPGTPAAPTGPGAGTPTEGPPASPPPTGATDGLTIESRAGDDSCFEFVLNRGGTAVALPKQVSDALACPATPPVVTPAGDGIVFAAGFGLWFWRVDRDPPRRLVLFDVKPDDEDFAVSRPAWSPDGDRLAFVSKATGYPTQTRLFVLTVSPAGEVIGKVKHDVAVFTPCGAMCVPQSPTWLDARTVEVVNPGADAAPGAKQTFSL